MGVDHGLVPSHHPGVFKMLVDGTALAPTFGNQSGGWMWQDGGTVGIKNRRVKIELQDLTVSTAAATRCTSPPTRTADRRPKPMVAWIHNRPVLGGNGSPEIGLTLRGKGRTIVAEAALADRDQLLASEARLKLFLNWHAFQVQKSGNRIPTVDARHTSTNQELRFAAPLFIDCTGVGAVGYWAGAEYRLGREAAAEFHESLAPEEARITSRFQPELAVCQRRRRFTSRGPRRRCGAVRPASPRCLPAWSGVHGDRRSDPDEVWSGTWPHAGKQRGGRRGRGAGRFLVLNTFHAGKQRGGRNPGRYFGHRCYGILGPCFLPAAFRLW